jgi:hypothetical protein
MEGCEEVQFKQHAIVEFLIAEKILPIDVHFHIQAIYGDKCVDESTFRCWVWQFKQAEVREASLCDKARSGEVSNCNRQVSSVTC